MLKDSEFTDLKNISVFLPTNLINIDNPRDYADNEDARKFDPRLRGPVDPVLLPFKHSLTVRENSKWTPEPE